MIFKFPSSVKKKEKRRKLDHRIKVGSKIPIKSLWLLPKRFGKKNDFFRPVVAKRVAEERNETPKRRG